MIACLPGVEATKVVHALKDRTIVVGAEIEEARRLGRIVRNGARRNTDFERVERKKTREKYRSRTRGQSKTKISKQKQQNKNIKSK